MHIRYTDVLTSQTRTRAPLICVSDFVVIFLRIIKYYDHCGVICLISQTRTRAPHICVSDFVVIFLRIMKYCDYCCVM